MTDTATTTKLAPEQIGEFLRAALESDVLDVTVHHGTATVTVRPEALPRAARLCKSEPRLRCEFFDWSSAVDLREEGFAVVVALYSVTHRHRVHLRTVAPGGREDPRVPTLTGVYRGADWYEREAYDMFGVTFDGHPGLLPRLLTVENFEGWPLRKEFLLGTREAKPWPGAKEPEERHDEPGPAQSPATIGNAEPMSAEEKSAAAAAAAEAVEPQREEVEYDRALYEQLIAEGKSERIARSRAKAAAMRARNRGPQPDAGDVAGAAAAQARTAAGDPIPSTPEGAAEVAVEDLADPSIAKDAAAGAVGGDVAAGAPGDSRESDQPVDDLAAEVRVGTGAPPVKGGAPGPESEGRHTGAVEQSGAKPAAETPGMTSDPEGTPERGQGGHFPNETPAPGPESDVPPEPGGTTALGGRRQPDVPLVPEPGAEDATMPEDRLAAAREETGGDEEAARDRVAGSEVQETPLIHEGGAEPAPSSGTDATDRGGPVYPTAPGQAESDEERP